MSERSFLTGERPNKFTVKTIAHEGETTHYCVCQPNCFSYCPHTVTVRDGRVVQTTLAPMPDERYNRICLRGLSSLQRIYDPRRIHYPMKRVGKRGEGKWQRISWDEAITMITDNWKENIAKYGPDSIVFHTGSGRLTCYHGAAHGAMRRLGNLLGVTHVPIAVDMAVSEGMKEVIGWNGPWPGNGPEDLLNANTIIVLGLNSTESQINYHHWFLDAKEKGAKLIVIDPVFTHIAAQADQYIPIRPASDAALMLGLMHCILRDNKQNDEFMRTKTVAPYLVRDDTGLFLRMSDLGHDDDNRAVVMDEDGNFGTVDDIEKPVLEGRFEVEGISCAVAGQLIRDRAAEYTPERVEELTDIPTDVLEELAARMMEGPTTIRCGWGGQAYNNGHMVGKAMMGLAGITGYIGAPGADMGAASINFTGFNWAYEAPTGRNLRMIPSLMFPEAMRTGKYNGEERTFKSMYVLQTNTASQHQDRNAFVRDVFDKMEFIVTADLEMTDTARLSDLVLPAAHFYEVDEFIQASASHPFIQFAEKAIDPVFEAKGDAHIARLLGNAMGLGEYFNKTDDEYFEEILDTDTCRKLGVTFETLKQKHAIRVFPEPWLDYGGKQAFPTPDKRMQTYTEKPQPLYNYGQDIPVEREHLPMFYEPTEAWPGTEAQKKYPLILLSERPRYRVHSQWAEVKWLRELDPEPIIKVNAKDAEERGLQNRDLVELYNDRGHAVARLIIDNSLMPGVIKYPKGWQKHQHVAGVFSELNSMASDPMGVNQSFFDATCEMRKWEEN